jgi:transcriptional regulator with XRE-family HTH domain
LNDSLGRRSVAPATPERWLLGASLRERRDQLGLSRETVAARMQWSTSKLYRIEHKGTAVDPRDVGDLCKLYRVPGDDRKALIQLAEESHQRGWWTEYPDVFTGRFVAFEAKATVIRAFGPGLITGLLQTPAYARAVVRSYRPSASDAEVDRRVDARMARQAILMGDSAPTLSVILGEDALRRCAESAPHLARDQLGALLAAVERPNISVRLHPFCAGVHGIAEDFVILGFPHEHLRLAYVGGLLGGLYVESIDGLTAYEDAWRLIACSALSEEETAEYLQSELRGIER